VHEVRGERGTGPAHASTKHTAPKLRELAILLAFILSIEMYAPRSVPNTACRKARVLFWSPPHREHVAGKGGEGLGGGVEDDDGLVLLVVPRHVPPAKHHRQCHCLQQEVLPATPGWGRASCFAPPPCVVAPTRLCTCLGRVMAYQECTHARSYRT